MNETIPGETLVAHLGGKRVARNDAPAYHGAVSSLCGSGGIHEPALFVIPSPEINAFTTGSGPERALVAVNVGLLRNATESELEAVIAHELGHVVHGDVQAKTRIALGSFGARVAGRVAGGALIGSIDEDDDLLSAGLKLLGGLAVTLAVDAGTAAYTTHRNHEHEFRADAYAAELTGKPWALASLLSKLERAPGTGDMPAELAQLFFTPPLSSVFGISTHPAVDERIARISACESRVEREKAAVGFCARCGERLREGHCVACSPQRKALSACSSCGALLSGEDRFCVKCGEARDV